MPCAHMAWPIGKAPELPWCVYYLDDADGFEADNSLRVYFRFESAADPARYSFQVDGRSAAARSKGDDTVYLSVENIAADALDTAHSFVITDGTSRYTVTVSVLGYARTAIERGGAAMANLGRALYLYNRAAENYFGA
mgnify:CR=1 FL=1